MSTLLAQPFTLPSGAVLPNRICKTAMTEGLADPHNRATARHELLYRRWSEGGSGLLITGNVQVDRHHPERPGNVAIDNNGGLDELRAYARAGRVGGNHLWMQISHAGRQTPGSVNRSPLAPSAVPLDIAGDGFGQPRAMTEEQILDVIRRFGHAAAVARETGFTGVQVHAAHGYLLSSFLSPLANHRTDAWGGSIENRARALIEVIKSVKAAAGADFPISVKLNSSDFQKGGYDEDDCIHVVRMLNAVGIDLLELSGGNYERPRMVGVGDEGVPGERASTRARETYFLDYTARIRPVATMPVMVVGGFRNRSTMEEALQNNALDVVGLARPLCVDPAIAHGLLSGAITTCDAPELTMKLNLADVPAEVPAEMHDALQMWGVQGWFCLQIIRLAQGLDSDRTRNVFEAFNAYAANEAATVAALKLNA